MDDAGTEGERSVTRGGGKRGNVRGIVQVSAVQWVRYNKG